MAEDATYRTTQDSTGATRYECLPCEHAGQEHYTTDIEMMRMHQAHRHGGVMVAEDEAQASPQAAPDHPHGGPPGQTGDHPEHPHGGPPGQTGEHPHEEEPHPEHPIVEPEEESTP